MNGKIDTHEQFLLRLRQNSIPDKILRALIDGNRHTLDEIQTIGGGIRGWTGNFPWLMKWFDNVTVVKRLDYIKASYLDPMPSTPIPVGVDVNVIMRSGEAGETGESSIKPAAGMPDHAQLKWPQMPPMCQEFPEFRVPTWYSTMKAMVARGKHIALSGPPGVGKDTAVIQLAAEEGRPLVTIGGDAGFRRRDLVGTPHIANGSSYFEVAEYAAAVVNGWWVLLTEVNAADADALMFINAQLAAPYIVTVSGKAYPVHPDFRLFVSYNPGLTGTKPLPQSFKDRFFSVKVPFFSSTQLKSILQAHGMPEADSIDNAAWPNMIVRFGIQMWDAYTRGQMRYQITTRRLIDATVLMLDKIEPDVKSALRAAVIAAIDSPVEAGTAESILRSL